MSISDELVKRLRHLEKRGSREWGVMDKAADRIEALTAERDDQKIARLEAVRSWVNAEVRVKELEGALLEIDALDPEGKVDGCSPAALRGLVLRMGEIARDALTKGKDNDHN